MAKKNDLERSGALERMGKLKAAALPGRYAGAAPAPERRARRGSLPDAAKG
uniref:hypothetical protein n=1 Tax=Bordetella sputigena TaxID=1416810 RepID=UPI0039EF932F